MSNVKDRQKHQAELESRVKERSASSRENVKKLYTAAKRAEETDIAAGNDEKTHMFLQAKSDARAFATYLRDNIMGSEGGGRAGEKLDRQMVEFEREYELNDSGMDSEEQVKAQLCLDLAKYRDKCMYRIMQHLLEEASFEHVETELEVPPNLALCTKDLQMVFNFFKTFRSLLRKTENIEVLRNEMAVAEQVREKTMQMDGLQEELLARSTVINDLKATLHAMGSDVTRTHMITQQQDSLSALEAKCKTLEEDRKESEANLRRAVQAKAVAEDLMTHVKKQLQNVRAAYDRDIARLRPLLEDHVNKSQQDMSDIRSIRVDSSLNSVRLKELEAKVTQAQQAANAAQMGERLAKKDSAMFHETIDRLETEVARQQRSKLVVVAAKMHFQEMSNTLEGQVATLEADLRNVGATNDEYYSKVNALQIELDHVRTSHADWTETEKAYKDQLKRMRTDVATLELQNRKLNEKLESVGDSEGGNQIIVKELEDQLKVASEKIEQLEKKTRTAMQRVYELQGQLMDKEEQERDRAKIARTQAQEAPTP